MSDAKPVIELDHEAEKLLERLARERGADPGAIASGAVRLFYELYGKSALDELDRRWAAYERSGESYTREEVEAWLGTWGARDRGQIAGVPLAINPRRQGF